jgi:DNA methyltransferase 1-associated protein 1
VWAPFTNTARTDNQVFYHWVKADVQYSDYAYAKFNVKVDQTIYSDAEYETLLRCDEWSREATDHLMYLCSQYDLRWPVISDRFSMTPARATEDLQFRYYSVLAKLRSVRLTEDENNAKAESFTSFEYDQERKRRYQQEVIFRK